MSSNGNGNGKESNGKQNKNGNNNAGQEIGMMGNPDFPEVEFGITSNGLSVTAPKLLKATRFVPWDFRGPFAHNEVVEFNYVIEADAMTIFATRFKKGKTIKFDSPLVLRKHGNCRISGRQLSRPDTEVVLRDLSNTNNEKGGSQN